MKDRSASTIFDTMLFSTFQEERRFCAVKLLYHNVGREQKLKLAKVWVLIVH